MYEVRYWRYCNNRLNSEHETLDEAFAEARELDESLSYGDSGIAFIRNVLTGETATVGNGALDNYEDGGRYANPLQWVKEGQQ